MEYFCRSSQHKLQPSQLICVSIPGFSLFSIPKFNFVRHQGVSSGNCVCFHYFRYLKYGSYPVINPDGAIFPENYLLEQSPIYEVHFVSNGSQVTLNVTSPAPGDWYAVAFLNTNSGKIIQKVSFVCAGGKAILLDVHICQLV